jgi:toxin ParE1/3/4
VSALVYKLPPARRDLVEIYYYYARKGTVSTARRFLGQAEATFQRLAKAPGIGSRYELDVPIRAELRFFPVSRYRNYLVFYRPVEGGIEVLRVLHGARDLQGILAEEFGIDEAGHGAEEP